MPPEDRRTALIAATVPLLRTHGTSVTTRQIAEAAGVAEGTIFGVFPDKDSLVQAALLSAADPADTLAAMHAIDRTAGLRSRLSAAAALVNKRFADNASLLSVARSVAFAPGAPADMRTRMADSRDRLLAALTDVIEPDRHRLRRDPATVARLLLLLAGANAYGPFGDPAHVTGDEMVALLLDGLLVRANEDAETPC
jgi:AcrR family transcriptional regulator